MGRIQELMFVKPLAAHRFSEYGPYTSSTAGSPGNLLEMPLLRPWPRSREAETQRVGPSNPFSQGEPLRGVVMPAQV